jgi:hypothetical protein
MSLTMAGVLSTSRVAGSNSVARTNSSSDRLAQKQRIEGTGRLQVEMVAEAVKKETGD